MPDADLPDEGWVSMHLWYCSYAQVDGSTKRYLNFTG